MHWNKTAKVARASDTSLLRHHPFRCRRGVPNQTKTASLPIRSNSPVVSVASSIALHSEVIGRGSAPSGRRKKTKEETRKKRAPGRDEQRLQHVLLDNVGDDTLANVLHHREHSRVHEYECIEPKTRVRCGHSMREESKMTHDTCCPVAGRVLVPELSDELDRVETGILREGCCEGRGESSPWTVVRGDSLVQSDLRNESVFF